MKSTDLMNAIGEADDKLIERSEHKVMNKRGLLKWSSYIAACLAVAVCATVVIPKLVGNRSENGITDDILVVSAETPVTYSGTEITDAEALEKLESIKHDIYSCFLPEIQSGTVSEIEICTRGYRHITLDTKNNIALDFIDYPVMSDGKAIGIITLFRDDETDGDICWTVSYGGEGISKFFQTVSGSPEKSYVASYLANSMEVLISSDNEIICINGGIAEGTFEKGVDFYSAFATEYNVISADIFDTTNAITVSE